MRKKPGSCSRKYKEDKQQEEYSYDVFPWNNVFLTKNSNQTLQFKPSLSGIALKHPEFYRFLYLLKMDISG